MSGAPDTKTRVIFCAILTCQRNRIRGGISIALAIQPVVQKAVRKIADRISQAPQAFIRTLGSTIAL